MSEREYKALRSVPASTWMEGFCVTKQMEEACMCLMSGEVSVTPKVKPSAERIGSLCQWQAVSTASGTVSERPQKYLPLWALLYP